MSGKYVTETLGPDESGIARAAEILRRGGLVAVPTETVYGLAARADSDAAVARIYAAKGRPSFNPLIVHVADVEAACALADLPHAARAIAERYWPAPLTLVVPRREEAGLAAAVSAGLPTIALRNPAHKAMAALLAECDFPLAAPSANRSGFVSPTTAAHVAATLDGRIDAIIDAGAPCPAGLESTILAIRADGTWQELRPGPVDLAALHARFGGDAALISGSAGDVEAPGQLASHYAPGKPVRLGAQEVAPDEFFIGFGAIAGDCNLSERGDLNEAAANLYACLHRAAADSRPRIGIAPVPDHGIGTAINDRLRRAATPPD